ncbi:hypothetical protein CYMTET_11973 [Cymbomonas tetramitiformis]|uniref:Uncharacterized protein n=1 Tax=Cymbomonas tetramitiformis TaxID=36881 RepID=A0AAE0GMN3_9CHLO|nr:hypothetical protein CYMTET_11973 [Cymbomonas tetramitiformis]
MTSRAQFSAALMAPESTFCHLHVGRSAGKSAFSWSEYRQSRLLVGWNADEDIYLIARRESIFKLARPLQPEQSKSKVSRSLGSCWQAIGVDVLELSRTWHPDKFMQKFGSLLNPLEEERILRRVTQVSQVLLQARQSAKK